MAYIICEPCIGTKDSACVDVCPVDCIHPRKDEPEFATAEMLFIHPDECIDCGACVPACPVEAIFALDETPDKWKSFIEKNSEYLPEQVTPGRTTGDQEIRGFPVFLKDPNLLICCKGCASRAAGSRASAASGPVSRGRRLARSRTASPVRPS